MRRKFLELKAEEAKNRGFFKRPIEFKVMYWMIWAQLVCITMLYWFTAFKIDAFVQIMRSDDNNKDFSYTLIMVLLRYVPSILMTLTYVMLYFQMQKLFVISRIKQRSAGRISQNQTMQIIKIVTWVLVGIFVIVEFMLIVLVLVPRDKNSNKKVIEPSTFEIQLVSVSGFIIIMMNIMMIVIYWKYAGIPFKSDQHWQNLRHLGFVCAFWTFAFIVKYATSFVK